MKPIGRDRLRRQPARSRCPIALLAGLVSFLSPCVLPLVPGYLGYVGGFTGAGGRSATARRLLLGVALFMLGFSARLRRLRRCCSAPPGLLADPLDGPDHPHRRRGRHPDGPRLHRPVHLPAAHLQAAAGRPRTGLAGAPLLGIVFGARLDAVHRPDPRRGPRLSLDGGSPWRGALLGLVYCLGLGIPFLLVALGFGWVDRVGRLAQAAHPCRQHHRRRAADRHRRAHGERALEQLHVTAWRR